MINAFISFPIPSPLNRFFIRCDIFLIGWHHFPVVSILLTSNSSKTRHLRPPLLLLKDITLYATVRANACSNCSQESINFRVELMEVCDWFSTTVAAKSCTKSCVLYCATFTCMRVGGNPIIMSIIQCQ